MLYQITKKKKKNHVYTSNTSDKKWLQHATRRENNDIINLIERAITLRDF